jgi:aspartate aminotransferase-like enzyme
MHPDVIRGMQESKVMLRDLFGTKNIYTYGIAGTGWSGLDCLHSAIQPGDKVVAFNNGTFSGIDCHTIRMKASLPDDFASDPMHPKPANVTVIEVAHGTSVTGQMVNEALAGSGAMWAAMTHWETGSGRINDIQGFSDACVKHGVMGLVDSVSSLGIEDFNTDDYPGVVGWASCPQKGVLALPLTYAPVTFTDAYIDVVAKRGCSTFVNHPILNARHWSLVDGEDEATAG